MTIFDCHTHIFPPAVIENVSRLNGLAASLSLDVDGARRRLDKAALKQEARSAGVHACLFLPTAPADGVRKINDRFLSFVEGEESLFTAGTLHPSDPGTDEELERLSSCGVRALKFSSFSQGFDLAARDTFHLFEKIQDHNLSGKEHFFVVLDTFYGADVYFGVPRKHVTTPEKLGRLAAAFPAIRFVGAHMGGLAAPWTEIVKHIVPGKNLYLDTSNAAHVLSGEQFTDMLRLHGPARILFGTDWPWFGHAEEVRLIQELLQQAGFSLQEQQLVFSGNITRLLGGKTQRLKDSKNL